MKRFKGAPQRRYNATGKNNGSAVSESGGEVGRRRRRSLRTGIYRLGVSKSVTATGV